jgi:hypothetical protein
MVPIAALFLVDIDANEGFGVRAMNLAQAVLEYDAMTFCILGHVGILLGLQQSCTVAVPGSAKNPAGHAVHTGAALAA